MVSTIKLSFISSILFLSSISLFGANTQEYYVDPDFAGGGRNGSQATPWQNLAESGVWTIVNSGLSSSNVTVYFSARSANADTNQLSTQQLLIDRTDQGPNTLTLDGKSFYNSNDATPSWSAYSGSSSFWIKSTYPINSDNTSSPYTNRVNMVLHGIFGEAVDGQIFGMYGCSNVIMQFCRATSDAGGTVGPGVHFAVPNQNSDGSVNNGSHPSYITIISNDVWNTRGEGIYIGGHAGDPPGVAGTFFAGSNIFIVFNNITNAGLSGNQGDFIDIKDGLRSLIITNNNIIATSAYSGGDNQGIICESGNPIIMNNLIVGASGMQRNGIVIASSWDNNAGRQSALIANNRVITATANGIRNIGANSAPYQWTNVFFYNNSIYNPQGGSGINLSGLMGPMEVKNNILYGASASEFPYDSATGMSIVHSNNVIYNPSDSIRYAHGEGSFWGSSDILTFEPSAVKTDPSFSSITTLQLSVGSSAIDKGTTLPSVTTDYLGTIRPVNLLYDIGAFEYSPIAPAIIAVLFSGKIIHNSGKVVIQ